MTEKRTERCGRCSVTAVLDATEDAERDREIIGNQRIELEDDQLRRTSPHVVLAARCKRWIDEIGRRLTYGRRDA